MKPWKKKILDSYFYIARAIYGVNKKKVAFVSFGGKTYSDSTRAVSEAVKKEIPDAEIVWFFKNPESKKGIVPDYVRCVNMDQLWRACKELATASAYVNNFSFPRIPKSKKQLFIQTWHGDMAIKNVLHDSPYTPKDKVYSEEIAGYCDYAIAGSDFGEKQYRTAFRYKGEVLKIGLPRNDRLAAPDYASMAKTREKLGLPEDVKILMYAPTLRKEGTYAKTRLEIKNIDLSATLSKLEERDGCKWICLMRSHPAMVGLDNKGKDERIMEVTTYEDMADLLLITDMLITDYSSSAADYSLLRRPVILFHADMQEYLENDRTLAFKMEDSPFLAVQSQEELENLIMQLTPEMAKENCDKILEFFGNCDDGKSSETIAKIIKDWMKK